MNNFVFYNFSIATIFIAFLWFVYLQNVDVYLGYIILLISIVHILFNWHYILDNKVHRIYKLRIWISIFFYGLIGCLFILPNKDILKLYIEVSIFLVMISPIFYYIKNRKRIINFMDYKKNIILLLIIFWTLSFIIYFKFGFNDIDSSMLLFLIIVTFQYVIQNIYLTIFIGADRNLKNIILIQMLIFILSCLLKQFFLGTLAFMFLGGVTSFRSLGILNKETSKNNYTNYLLRLQQLSDETKYNKEIADYFHDDVLQDIIFLKKAIDEKELSGKEISEGLNELILSIRNKIDGLAPIIIPSQSLYENIYSSIKQISNRYKDKALLVDFFCDKEIYLENPYDIIAIKIIKELLNNIYKHTSSNFAEISIIFKNDKLIIISKNDEVFFDKNKFYSNKRFSGLKQIERNVRLIDGSINIVNDDGVKITISFPLKRRIIIENSINRRS